MITPEIAAAQAYAVAYNRALVDQPSYPDGDLCRQSSQTDAKQALSAFDVGSPARRVSTPPRSIYEAARRGSVADLKHQSDQPMDGFDQFGMTPLAWAVARNNQPVVDYLLSKGANPWLSKEAHDRAAVFWAAALGRANLFARLIHVGQRPFRKWPSFFIRAAVASGDQGIVRSILAEPHEQYRNVTDFPPAQTMALILADSPKQTANDLLTTAVGWSGSDHLDLVRLALAHGADPDAVSSNWPKGTALGISAAGTGKTSVEAVHLLLHAGANLNLMSGDRRPIWQAANTLMLDKKWNEVDDRAKAIFLTLAHAGADLKLPNADGKPPIWSMLFPLKYDPTKLDPMFLTPDLLRLFVDNGMDVNARWNGQLVLKAVEHQAGRDSELAANLRAHGAHDS